MTNRSSVCVATIVRVYTITKMKSSVDITWVIGDAMIWSNVEPCIGIVSACLPTLRPLLRRIPKLGLFSSRLTRGSRSNSKPGMPGADPESITNSANRSAYRSANAKRGRFRPEEDEIYLTTDVGRGSSLRKYDEVLVTNESVGSENDSVPMQIRVNHKFQWSEENR